MKFPLAHYIERDGQELELDVIYDITPRIPAILYGDYPQPEEGGEIELISVKHMGHEIELTEAEENVLILACAENDDDDYFEGDY